MNSKRVTAGFKVFIVVVFVMSLLGGWAKPANAETCTWDGSESTDWAIAGNWSCVQVPGVDDDVVIPSGTPNPPIIAAMSSVTVNSITINSGATSTILNGSGVNAGTWTINGNLTANATSDIYINLPTLNGGAMNVSSTGSLTKLGTENFFIFAAFENAGTVSGASGATYTGNIVLKRGGTNTGIFQGESLYLDDDVGSGQIYDFDSGSELRINKLYIRGGAVNIQGKYYPPNNTGTILSIQPYSGTCMITCETDGNFVKMPENIIISSGGKLILENQTYDYYLPKLYLDNNSELQNLGNLHITTQILLYGGKISGNGTTAVEDPAVFTIGLSTSNGSTLDDQTLINNSTANWNAKNITLSNGAEFKNIGTFNANATTTMTGGTTEVFTNNGSFTKNTADTTTTMNIPFTNNGTVQVTAGELVFMLAGGTYDPGETLNLGSGEVLAGSGTLAANLVNSGTVSPGASPGVITVEGDYTQSPDGVLEIQLGGTTPGTGHDQLVVTGAATLNGILNVSLIYGFEPQVGDSFIILPYGTRSGEFSTLNLPEEYQWDFDYTSSGVILTVLEERSISGTVTCDSTQTVFVDLWLDDYTSAPPEDSKQIACGKSYSFTNLPDGTYYVGAWIDLDGSGAVEGPDDGEPYAWYGNPTTVEITAGNSQSNIDISFPTGSINGTVTCDSTHTVFVDLYTDNTTPPPADTVHAACGGSYSFEFLPDGVYYVSAWIDLDDSGGGPPGDDETIIWYGDPTAVTITDGETKSGIDIVFPEEGFTLFLPLILR